MVDDVRLAIREEFDTRDKKKLKDSKVIISKATQTRVKNLYDLVGFVVIEGDPLPQRDDVQFDPFDWNGREEDEAMNDARNHVMLQLKKLR